jgi:HprK-related kinase A
VTVGSLGYAGTSHRLSGAGLGLRCGPLSLRILSDQPLLWRGVLRLYEDHPLVPDSEFCDGQIVIRRMGGLGRWFRPEVQAHFDHQPIFEPVPQAHALALLEWMLNWLVSAHVHQFAIVHAATLERGGLALMLPAPSGSGKSTLCAALAHRGWRVLSDELALIDVDSGQLHALARPVSLKNRSIDLLRGFAPEAVLSEPAHGTPKGTMAFMKLPAEHVRRMHETARARWIVKPQWRADAAPALAVRAKADTLMDLGRNAINLDLAGGRGFHRLADLVAGSDCLDLTYGALDDGVALLDAMARGRAT